MKIKKDIKRTFIYKRKFSTITIFGCDFSYLVVEVKKILPETGTV